jgi:predicted ATPase
VKITLENVRGFIQTSPIEIKPLTFLVGENSSGKSTFLAALSAIERGALLQYRPLALGSSAREPASCNGNP